MHRAETSLYAHRTRTSLAARTSRHDPAERSYERAISLRELGPGDLTPKYPQLVPQKQDLNLLLPL